MVWIPQDAYFSRASLEYPLGRQVRDRLQTFGTRIHYGSPPTNRKAGPQESFRQAKETLLVEVNKFSRFQTCKPSADYQLPLVNSCPGACSYCYLFTTLGKRPFNRVYVNREEIFHKAQSYLAERWPETVAFEGAATSDPLPTEHLTDSLAHAVLFFARQPNGRFRFVTKFTDVEPLLPLDHQKRTMVRFSINTPRVIGTYEHRTPSLEERLQAAQQVAKAGYPLGFIIGPIFLEGDWQREYRQIIDRLSAEFSGHPLDLELITHRFTPRAKETIERIFPQHQLPMREEERQWKTGQFGYGKYVYPREPMLEAKRFFVDELSLHPEWEIRYFV